MPPAAAAVRALPVAHRALRLLLQLVLMLLLLHWRSECLLLLLLPHARNIEPHGLAPRHGLVPKGHVGGGVRLARVRVHVRLGHGCRAARSGMAVFPVGLRIEIQVGRYELLQVRRGRGQGARRALCRGDGLDGWSPRVHGMRVLLRVQQRLGVLWVELLLLLQLPLARVRLRALGGGLHGRCSRGVHAPIVVVGMGLVVEVLRVCVVVWWRCSGMPALRRHSGPVWLLLPDSRRNVVGRLLLPGDCAVVVLLLRGL